MVIQEWRVFISSNDFFAILVKGSMSSPIGKKSMVWCQTWEFFGHELGKNIFILDWGGSVYRIQTKKGKITCLGKLICKSWILSNLVGGDNSPTLGIVFTDNLWLTSLKQLTFVRFLSFC